jgi:hypothetical protein
MALKPSPEFFSGRFRKFQDWPKEGHRLRAVRDVVQQAANRTVGRHPPARNEARSSPSDFGAEAVADVSPCKFGKCRVILRKCREAASISRLNAVRFQ